jgi:hypothetical protein
MRGAGWLHTRLGDQAHHASASCRANLDVASVTTAGSREQAVRGNLDIRSSPWSHPVTSSTLQSAWLGGAALLLGALALGLGAGALIRTRRTGGSS